MKKSALVIVLVLVAYLVNGFYPRTVKEPVTEQPVVEVNNIGRIETLDCVQPQVGSIETLDVVEVIE